MASYVTGVAPNSPFYTYSSVGDNSTGWVNTPLIPYEVAYWTAAPKASVSFDFYGDQLELSGYLAPLDGPGIPDCDYNVTLNGELQNQSYYTAFNSLPLDQYHVNLTVFCPGPGQAFGFTGAAFVETQGNGTDLYSNTAFLSPPSIDTIGQWQKELFYSGYYAENFTQFTTNKFGSTLAYSFKGVATSIVGSVGPNGSVFITTIDGVASKFLSTNNTTPGDSIVLWFAEFLKNDTDHFVTITNLGLNNHTQLAIQGVTVTTIQVSTE